MKNIKKKWVLFILIPVLLVSIVTSGFFIYKKSVISSVKRHIDSLIGEHYNTTWRTTYFSKKINKVSVRKFLIANDTKDPL